MNPQFPIYIPSKGRADSRITVRHFETMGVPYRVIVEQSELETYAAVIDPSKLLVLDPAFQDQYVTLDDAGDRQGMGKGSGPARNFAWAHAIAAGHPWHWIVDDNIAGFYRLNKNTKTALGDGTMFRCIEDFALRYRNIAMAGPQYEMFAPRKKKFPPLILNTRIYSCILIRNDIGFRWRGRYNEDTDLSLRVLKSGWCTVQFMAFLQKKMWTQKIKGGNTDELYAHGTLPKSQLLARLHPDVARVVWKYSRWHHHVDYSRFARNKLLRRTDIEIPTGVDEYGLTLRQERYRAEKL